MKNLAVLLAVILSFSQSSASENSIVDSEYESLSLRVSSDIERGLVVNHADQTRSETYLTLSETHVINSILFLGVAVSGFGTLGLIANTADLLSPGSMTFMSINAALLTVEFGIGTIATGCGLKTLNRWGYGLFRAYRNFTRQAPSETLSW